MRTISDTHGNRSRRKFLKSGALAAAGAVLAAGDARAARPGADPSERPYVTGVSGKTIIGCYSSADQIVKNPKFIDALQKKLGVNALIVGSSIKMPEWLKTMNPLGPKTFMHVGPTDDDSLLLKAIEETHRRGMDFWLYFSGHHYGEESRSIMGETFEGIKFIDLPLIPYAYAQSEYTACFAKPAVREWETAVFGYAAKTYDVDSMYVSHYRYATPSFWTNLFGCACTDCRKAARRMGYDFDAMRDAMTNLRSCLERLDRKTVEHAAKYSMTFTDFLTLLGENNGALDWLVFRAKVTGEGLRRIHDAVHTETNHRSGFVTDTHCTTMSLLVGHNHEEFVAGASDALHPLTWLDWQYLGVVVAWAGQLCRWVAGLDETTAIRFMLSLFGWDSLGLPDEKIADYAMQTTPPASASGEAAKLFYSALGSERLIALLTHEFTRMAAFNRGRIPAHPVIKGFEWPEKVCRELMDRTRDLGMSGYIFQRTDVFIDPSKL
jgi:hypothetical protein